mmetsp:Transcript_46217/g.109378  ORF Transcript_46217/g.109378 Transcript_46217/m.109378 type:complete len:232 (+) Transcript_46217:846-1541(+)
MPVAGPARRPSRRPVWIASLMSWMFFLALLEGARGASLLPGAFLDASLSSWEGLGSAAMSSTADTDTTFSSTPRRSSGSRRMVTSAVTAFPFSVPWYWKAFSTGWVTISRCEICTFPAWHLTLNCRSSLVRITSKCSSPIPPMTVSPVSRSSVTRRLGSSRVRHWRPKSSCGWSSPVSASRVQKKTAGGTCMPRRVAGCLSEDKTSVSPVRVPFRPTTATIPPALNSSTSS